MDKPLVIRCRVYTMARNNKQRKKLLLSHRKTIKDARKWIEKRHFIFTEHVPTTSRTIQTLQLQYQFELGRTSNCEVRVLFRVVNFKGLS